MSDTTGVVTVAVVIAGINVARAGAITRRRIDSGCHATVHRCHHRTDPSVVAGWGRLSRAITWWRGTVAGLGAAERLSEVDHLS